MIVILTAGPSLYSYIAKFHGQKVSHYHHNSSKRGSVSFAINIQLFIVSKLKLV